VCRLAEGGPSPLLTDSLAVSYHSDDFAEAEEAKQALAVAAALCASIRRTAGDAQDQLAGVDPELPGLALC
jgi:hypothetical protein